MKKNPKQFNRNVVLAALLVLSVAFSIVQIIRANPAPNPGHDLPEIGNDAGDALPVARGGTGTTTLTANAVILGNGTGAVRFVAPGTSGNVLTSDGTTWQSNRPSALAGTIVLLYSDETDTTVSNSTEEQNFSGKNWVINFPPNTYTRYLLEAEVAYDRANNANSAPNAVWRFNRDNTILRSLVWNGFGSTIANLATGPRRSATISVIVNNDNFTQGNNLKLSGQMGGANSSVSITAHSFRVYGIR